jgi:Flp pilus assembly protein TadG
MRSKLATTWQKFRKGEGGIAAIEFAIVFPVMILMYFGMLDLTQFITVNRRVQAAAAVVADLVTANEKQVSSSQVTDYYNAADMMLAPTPPSNVRVEVFTFKSDGSLRWSSNNGRGPNCGNDPTSANLGTMRGTPPANDVTVSRVCSSYQPFFGQFMGSTLLGTSSITLTKAIYQRPRLSPKLCLNSTTC